MYKVVYWHCNNLQEPSYSLSFYEALKAASAFSKMADTITISNKESMRLLILKENSSIKCIEECYDNSGRSITMNEVADLVGGIYRLRAITARDTCVWSGLFSTKEDALAAIPKIALTIKAGTGCTFELYSGAEGLPVYYDKYGGAIA